MGKYWQWQSNADWHKFDCIQLIILSSSKCALDKTDSVSQSSFCFYKFYRSNADEIYQSHLFKRNLHSSYLFMAYPITQFILSQSINFLPAHPTWLAGLIHPLDRNNHTQPINEQTLETLIQLFPSKCVYRLLPGLDHSTLTPNALFPKQFTSIFLHFRLHRRRRWLIVCWHLLCASFEASFEPVCFFFHPRSNSTHRYRERMRVLYSCWQQNFHARKTFQFPVPFTMWNFPMEKSFNNFDISLRHLNSTTFMRRTSDDE